MATQPTPADFDTAYAEAVATAASDVTLYDTLTFSSTVDTTGKIRAVLDTVPLETNQGVYLPYDIDFTPADTEGGVVGQITITVGYMPPSGQEWLSAEAAAGANLSVTWQQYLAPHSDPSFEYRMPFYITTADNVNGRLTLTATLPDLLNTPFCRRLMTTREFPGLAGL